VPGVFMPLDALPRTPNGKIDRATLPAPERVRTRTADDVLPVSSPLEKQLAAIWEELLGIDQVSPLDNFFDLGGHSLLSMRVVARLEKATGVRIGPGELILQTLGQVAAVCEQAQAELEDRPSGSEAGVVGDGDSSADEAAGRPGWIKRLWGRGQSPSGR
jgi:myxalamid-type nonribosomal peptide synthetase MxaA